MEIGKNKVKQNLESSTMVRGLAFSFTMTFLCQINTKAKSGATQNRLFSPKQHPMCQYTRLKNLPKERNYSGDNLIRAGKET